MDVVKDKKKKIPADLDRPKTSFLDSLPATTLSLTLFLTPLFPDEKLNRLKLIALGSGMILTGLLWGISKSLETRWTFSRTPLDLPIGIYGLSAILFYAFSKNQGVAESEFQRMIFSVGSFFAGAQAASGASKNSLRKWIFSGWMAGLFLISIYGILQKSGGIGRIQVPQTDRVFATFGNPIFFAAFLILSIPIAIGLLLESKAWIQRCFFFLTTCIALWALYYTGTRAAFLALPIALGFFYFLFEIRSGWSLTKGLWKHKGKIFLAGLVALFLAFSSSKARESAWKSIRASRMTATSQTHTMIWKDVLKMWRAHPWLGTGFGTFHIEFPAYASEELKAAFPQGERIVNDAHNEYLQILAETGLAGFVIFMAILAIFYAGAVKFYLTTPVVPPPVFLGLLAGALALLIENFFSVDMRFIVSSAYLFLAMGLAASLYAVEKPVSWPSLFPLSSLRWAWAAFFILASGAAGLIHKPFDRGLWPALLRPYRAKQVLKSEPDFFDDKILNNAQSIGQLEGLTQKYPNEWKLWDKLGFAFAKEIERKDAKGGKVVYPDMAEKSVQAYVRAYQLNPKAEGPPNNIGNIYYTMKQPNEAILWWKRAIESGPEKIDARLNLGLALYYQGKIKESAEQFQEVLKRDPKNKKAIVTLKRMVE